MNSEQTIVAGGVVIVTVGFIGATVNNKPKTPVFAGGVGVVLIAALLSMFGPGPAKIGTAFMGLAVTAVLLVEAPGLFQALSRAQKGSITGAKGAAPAPGGGGGATTKK